MAEAAEQTTRMVIMQNTVEAVVLEVTTMTLVGQAHTAVPLYTEAAVVGQG